MILTIPGQDDSGKSAAASPKDVMAGLEQVFAFLADNLADKEVIGKLGCGLGRPFCQELVKRCIAPSVPNRREDLSSFSIGKHFTSFKHTKWEVPGISRVPKPEKNRPNFSAR